MKKIVLVKLGGGLITNKTIPNSINMSTIDALAIQVRDIVRKGEHSLILGTGAGSFGHPPARKYAGRLREGFAVIADAVARLNRIVVGRMVSKGINAVSVNPSSVITAANSKVENFHVNPMLGLVEIGMIPVYYGDVVYDRKTGAAVMSLDRQLAELAKTMKGRGMPVDRVIFCGGTPGVIGLDGKTLRSVGKDDAAATGKLFYPHSGVDVSGGMKRKVETALELAESDIRSYIIDGKSLASCILENKFLGTVIGG